MGYDTNLSDSGVSSVGSQADLSIFLDDAQAYDHGHDSAIRSLEARSDRSFTCMYTDIAEEPDIDIVCEDDDASSACYLLRKSLGDRRQRHRHRQQKRRRRDVAPPRDCQKWHERQQTRRSVAKLYAFDESHRHETDLITDCASLARAGPSAFADLTLVYIEVPAAPTPQSFCVSCSRCLPVTSFSRRQARKVPNTERKCIACVDRFLDERVQRIYDRQQRDGRRSHKAFTATTSAASFQHQQAFDNAQRALLQQLLAGAEPILREGAGSSRDYSFVMLNPPACVRQRFFSTCLKAGFKRTFPRARVSLGSMQNAPTMKKRAAVRRLRHVPALHGTFHGTCSTSLCSIAERGLLVGGAGSAPDEVPMRNGAVMGRGIYSTDALRTAMHYTSRSSCTMSSSVTCVILCAVIDDSMTRGVPVTRRHFTDSGGRDSIFVSSRCDAVLPLGAILSDLACLDELRGKSLIQAEFNGRISDIVREAEAIVKVDE